MCLNVSGVFGAGARCGNSARFKVAGTYEVAELAPENIVKRLATLESTFGRSDGMLTKVLGTSLRGSE
jgi:hypothetical protein